MTAGNKELSWSLTKARTFEECPRRYYYHYYLSRAGNVFDAPDEARLALEMKGIQSLDMWAGEVVHSTIQWTLEAIRGGGTPSAEEARAEAKRRLSRGWRGSAGKLWKTEPKGGHANLFEHYYGMAVGDKAVERVKDKTYVSVRSFMESDILREIAGAPADRWLPIEKYASFRMDGLLVYVKFDFALRDGAQLTVYDWKTGKPTAQELLQLTVYAMYASDKWGVPIENTKVCAVHLHPELDSREHLIGVPEMDEVREHLKQSFKGMVSHLRNPSRDIAAMDDFPMTGNLARCPRCNFKGICPQSRIAEGRLDDEDVPIPDDWEL